MTSNSNTRGAPIAREAPLDGFAAHLLERSSEAIVLVTPSDFVVNDASRVALEALGLSPNDLRSATLDQLLFTECQESADRFWGAVRAELYPLESPKLLAVKSASKGIFRCVVNDRFPVGDCTLLAMTLQECLESECTETEQSLLSVNHGKCGLGNNETVFCTETGSVMSSDSCEQLLDDARAIIWESNFPYQGMLYVSRQLESILGYTAEHWIENPDGWANSIIEEDRKQALGYCNAQAENGRDHDFVYRARASDGRIVWIHDHVHVIKNAAGNPIKLRGVMTDITARKIVEEQLRQHESHLRLLVENVPVCIHSIDQDRKIESINPAGVMMAGGEDASDLIGKEYMSFVHQNDYDRIESLLEQAFQGRRSDLEFTCLTSGGPRVFQSNFIPIQDSDGAIRHVIGTSEDITERRKTRDRLRERETQLAHVNRLSTMGEMVAGVAHEVNQPLYSIVNFAKAISVQLDRSEPLELDTLRDWNNQIRTSATLAGEIIQRLRQFVSQAPSLTQPIDLHEIADDAVELVDHTIRRAGVVIKRQYEASEAIVQADVVQIQQVIINLLVNAVEAIELGDGDERLIVVGTRVDQDRVVLAVADSGCGLPKGLQKNLFDAFVSTKKDGMGMGLAISHTIVESFDGKLTALDNEMSGASFEISLPISSETVDV